MKIEIDLNNIFADENGAETLEESVRRQVVDRLSGDMRKRLFDRIDGEVARVMNEQIAEVMSEKMPELIDDIMNATYTPVSNYGSKGAPTTFREEIIKAIAANLVYKPSNYASEENAFTRAVKSVLDAKTKAIQEAIVNQVDGKFKTDAITFAVKKLSERLGIKTP